MTTGFDGPLHLVLGPLEHGVTRHALELAAAAGESVRHLATPSPPEPAAVLSALGGLSALSAGREGRAVHLHVTDRLCGSTPEAAAALVEQIAEHHRLTLTLHDLPQQSDGPRGFPRRAAAYRRMAEVARGVQVCSRHEQLLLNVIAPGVASCVVPLPVPNRSLPADPLPADPLPADPLPADSLSTVSVTPGSGSDGGSRSDMPRSDVPTSDVPTVGVLGFLYPGKGHAEVLQALDRLDRPDVALVALGRPSDGHAWLVDDLRALAGRRSLEITGYLDDDALDRRIRGVTVPVMAHTHVSASGSLHRWIGCGRRPVTVANRYTVELASAMPGAVTLTDDLPAAIGLALQRPATTWRDPGVAVVDLPGAAALQSRAIRRSMVENP